MTLRNNKFLSGMAGSAMFTFALFAAGIVSVRANGNPDGNASGGDRKAPLVRAHDLATEKKTQIESDNIQKRAFVDGNVKNRKAQGEENMPDRQRNLCSTMIERNEKLSERLNEVQKNIADRKMTRRNIFDEHRDERDAALKTNRNERDAKREEMYVKLFEQAGDDSKKQAAVAAFKLAVETAVANRKQLVDAAIAAFRTGVDAEIGTKKTTVNANLSTFKIAVDAAFATAKSDCASGADPATIRETLRMNLKVARAGMESERKDADTVGEQVRVLAEEKKASFATALSDFKLALEQARADLKAAFETTESESESNS